MSKSDDLLRWPTPIFVYGGYAISEEDGRIIGDGIYDDQVDTKVNIFGRPDYSDPIHIIGPAIIRIEEGKGYAYVDSDTYMLLENQNNESGFLTICSSLLQLDDKTIVDSKILYLFWANVPDKRFKE